VECAEKSAEVRERSTARPGSLTGQERRD